MNATSHNSSKVRGNVNQNMTSIFMQEPEPNLCLASNFLTIYTLLFTVGYGRQNLILLRDFKKPETAKKP